jgi:anti-sigma factor RsiW
VTCGEARALMHGYLDGELDVAHSLEVERHLAGCAACARAYQNLQTLSRTMAGGDLAYAAPVGLEARVRGALREAAKAPPPPRALPWRGLSLAAALAVVALLIGGWWRGALLPGADDTLTGEVVASHVRSLMAGHLADVPSSDKHTVKPWFDGKLDFSPPVDDFAAEGFPLVGGRLDYLDNRPVAALVYMRQKHVINLFVWPVAGGPTALTQPASRQGYNVFRWSAGGMAYWAVSDLNPTELREFVALAQNGAPAGPTP